MTAIVTKPREGFGSKAAQRERAQGLVPASISRAGKPSAHVTLAVKDAEALVAGELTNVLSLDGVEQRVLLKAVDRHPIKDGLQHIDLQGIDDETIIKVEIPLDPDTRNCPGIRSGGMLEMMRRTVTVRCLAKDLPKKIRVPLDNANVADTVYAGDCALPEGVKLVTGPRVAVLSILLTRGMRKAAQEGGKEE
jgi:large subunit ribosomal protein L25